MAAALAAGLVSAQFVAGKATRDALYLANLDLASLPTMVATSALVSIALVGLAGRITRRTPPGIVIPGLFAMSAILLLGAWGTLVTAPRSTAVIVYLLISGVGPMLGSGFWLIATEGFDPRTAKRSFGRITAAGTIGGLAGGLLAERVASTLGIMATLPILAAVNLFSAWQVYVLARRFRAMAPESAGQSPAIAEAEPARSGLRVLAGAPYLRSLVFLVALGSGGVVFADFVLKAQAVTTFGNGDTLLRFFGVYYGLVSLLTFAVQASSSRVVLERFGLGAAAAAPSVALMVGGLTGIAYPGLTTAAVARGGESVFRGSLFKAGYELYFTAVSTKEKRAAKSLIDVVFDRLGEAAGAGLVRLVLVFQGATASGLLLGLAVACSAAALAVAARLNRGYIGTLEQNLRHRAADLDLSLVGDRTTRAVLLTTTALPGQPAGRRQREASGPSSTRSGSAASLRDRPAPDVDDEVKRIIALRSGDPERVRAALAGPTPLAGPLVGHAIPLLAWDLVAGDVARALCDNANRSVGALVDALTDPNQEFAVRRRLARVFSECRTQRAVEGLLLGLEDPRFEVRFQCARSLATITRRHGDLRVDRDRVLATVLRETTVGKLVWESQRLLGDAESQEDDGLFLDQFVRDRASRSLTHVFTLLSLVLPAVPLQVAFRGLHTNDQRLRGTALEYLEGVLPPEVRLALWPYLDDAGRGQPSSRTREDVVADLLRSHESIVMNLEDLRRRATSNTDTPAEDPTRDR